MKLNDADRDLLVRTIIGEAAQEPDEGLAAVGHVVLNRLNSGKWGSTLPSVLFAPKQFEPWDTRAEELMSYAPDDPSYRRAAKIVDDVVAGRLKDPTNGATHFLNPEVVRERRGGTLPAWAAGEGLQIGRHSFYAPEGPVRVAQTAADMTDADIADAIRAWGLGRPRAAQPGASTTPGASGKVAQETTPEEIARTLQQWGLVPGTQKAPAPVASPRQAIPEPPEAKTTGRYAPGVEEEYKKLGFGSSILAGMPVIGPAELLARSAGRAAAPNVFGGSKEATFGERFQENLQTGRLAQRAYDERNPLSSLAGGLLGSTALMGPLSMTNVGRQALGMSGPTLGSRALTGMAGGATIGSMDAWARGESPWMGGGIGGAAGFAGPILGKMAERGLSSVSNVLAPRTGTAIDAISPRARGQIIGALEGETPASLAAAQTRAGSGGMLADLSQGLTDKAGAIADIPGPGKAVMREAYQRRADEQAQRIDAALTQHIMPRVNIEQFKQFTTEARKAAADPLYEQFRQTVVHPTDEIKKLIPRLESSGAFKMAEELAAVTGDPVNMKFFTGGAEKDYPTAQTWDYIKRALDRRIDAAYSSGDKTMAKALVGLRNDVIREVEKAPGGQIWKQARKEFADRSAILDQIEAGRDTFLGGRSGLSADELREELRGLSGPERLARIAGLRAAADEVMGGTVIGDTTLRNKLLAPNNREKMKHILGEERADKLIAAMESEKFLGDKTKEVIGGSPTSAKIARREAAVRPPVEPWGLRLGEPMTYLPPSWRREFTPANILNARRNANDEAALNELAPILTQRAQGAGADAFLRALGREAVRRGRNAERAAMAGNALAGIITLPGATTARRHFLPTE